MESLRLTHARLLLLVALAACCFAVLPAMPAGAAQAPGIPCPDADTAPTAANLAVVRAAVLCLHNRERAARGLPALRESAKLRRAAERHSTDMVRARYFGHDAPGGSDMVDRVLATGYAANRAWSLGENIAWASGSLATATEIHRAWMESGDHRANILRRQFREIGIGIALGAPVAASGADGATYTADFGVRR